MADYSDPSYVKQMVHINSLLILLKNVLKNYLMGAKLKLSPLSVHTTCTLRI